MSEDAQVADTASTLDTVLKLAKLEEDGAPLIRTAKGESLRRECRCVCHDNNPDLELVFHMHGCGNTCPEWRPVDEDTAFRIVLEWCVEQATSINFNPHTVILWPRESHAITAKYRISIPTTLFAAVMKLPQVKETVNDNK